MLNTGIEHQASGNAGYFVKNCLRKYILTSFWLMLLSIASVVGAFGSVLSDPGVPDGEQTAWQVTKSGRAPIYSTITWRVKNRNGKPVYEITEDSGERKQGKYIIDKSDLHLIWAYIIRDTEEGKSEATIEVKDKHQYLIHTLGNKKPRDKKIDYYPDGYDGVALGFSLRGFPFREKNEVEIRITPPFTPSMSLWAWKMWKSYAKLLGTEKVTVPAGTFDCYKLEIAASGGLIRHFTSEYYFWFTKEPPHYFVKYQDKDVKRVTEMMEIKSRGGE